MWASQEIDREVFLHLLLILPFCLIEECNHFIPVGLLKEIYLIFDPLDTSITPFGEERRILRGLPLRTGNINVDRARMRLRRCLIWGAAFRRITLSLANNRTCWHRWT